MLDVLQIFGRAGRPGMETSGEGYICTSDDKLDHYLDAITAQVCSSLHVHLAKNLIPLFSASNRIHVSITSILWFKHCLTYLIGSLVV